MRKRLHNYCHGRFAMNYTDRVKRKLSMPADNFKVRLFFLWLWFNSTCCSKITSFWLLICFFWSSMMKCCNLLACEERALEGRFAKEICQKERQGNNLGDGAWRTRRGFAIAPLTTANSEFHSFSSSVMRFHIGHWFQIQILIDLSDWNRNYDLICGFHLFTETLHNAQKQKLRRKTRS